MKKWGLLLSVTIFSISAPGVAAPSSRPTVIQAPAVIEQGPHHRKWQYTSLDDVGGKQVEQTHSYIELKSGMNVWRANENRWVEAEDKIELFQNGAVARKSAHEVIFAPNIADKNGTIDLLMPGNKRLRSRVAGIAYTEPESGKSAMIAELKHRVGELVALNQISYPDAFDSIKADVRYTVTVASFEQDVILREQLPSPTDFGLAPDKTQVEVWTEFFEAPEPNKKALRQAPNPFEADEQLDFGSNSMTFGQSQAFTLSDGNLSPAPQRSGALRSRKQWIKLEGRTFLIEVLPFNKAQGLMKDLPKPQAKRDLDPDKLRRMAGGTSGESRQFPSLVADKPKPAQTPVMVAAIKPGKLSRDPGVVLDYVLVNGSWNSPFQSDTTYYVSGTTYGYFSFEGGAIIKYAPGTALYLYSDFSTTASAYRPVICTAKDDDSVGEIISGSTGNPTGTYATVAISLQGSGSSYVHDFRFYNAYIGLDCYPQTTIRHCQFLNCSRPIMAEGEYTYTVANVLCQNFTYAFTGYNTSYLRVEFATLHGGTQLIYNPNGQAGFFVYNSLIVGVTDSSGADSGNQILTSDSGVFETAGGGAHYLAANSPYRNVGYDSFDAQTLADMRKRTTYPPTILTNNVTLDTVLNPQVPADLDKPDLGYHYDRLDFLVSLVNVSNASLLLTNGVAVGCYGSDGITLSGGGKVIGEGTPANLNHVVRYRAVQEQAMNSIETYGHLITCDGSYSPTPEVRMRFTAFSLLPTHAASTPLRSPSDGPMVISLRDCQFRGGTLLTDGTSSLTLEVSNCLYERARHFLRGTNVTFYNNTFYRGDVRFNATAGETYTVKDNLFDQTIVANNTAGTWNLGNNGYISGYSRLTPTGPNDVIIAGSPQYQTGTLGSYYLPSWSAFLNVGSRSADYAGLYHYTTQTGQSKETTSTVDIGFHYVALNGQSLVVDTDGDGWPDYWEDRNGNGVFESGLGETDWSVSNSSVSAPAGIQVFTPLK